MAMPAASSVSNGYRLSEINLNFINPEKYTPGMSIKNDGALKECPVQVRCYYDFEKLEGEFDIHKHGFQFCRYEEGSELALAIDDYRKTPLSFLGQNGFTCLAQNAVRSAIEKYLKSWGPKNGIQGKPFLDRDILHRSSDPNIPFFTPARFVHVDHLRERVVDPETHEGEGYKDMVTRQFPRFHLRPDADYKNFIEKETTVFFKVWIPIHDEKSPSGCAFLDISSVPNLKEELRTVSSDPGSKNLSLFPDSDPNSKRTWVMAEGLTLKDRLFVVFNAVVTPHSGAKITDNTYSAHRTNIELRGLIAIPPEM
jgi:hypothetical protein